MKITAKECRAAAASVRGARSMGVETAASKAAPDLLARAEAALATMFSRASGLEPSAPDQAAEAVYGAAFAKADALEAAIAELRDALGVPAPAVEHAPAVETVEEAVKQDAAAAAEELRLQQWDAAVQESPVMFAADGQRLAMVQTRAARYGESRFSSLGGWDAGGERLSEAEYEIQTRSGRAVQRGERYVVLRDGEEGVEAVDYIDGRPAGAYGMTNKFSATSEWLPESAAEPLSECGFVLRRHYPRGDIDCAQAWADAQAARRAERAAAREAKALPDEQEKTWTLADLAALSKRGQR